ncbi:MAG TPA: hypothetical protein VIM11_01285 [Tepidisphaeraceae bacterium]|jgi:hypothetical protein
MDLKAWLQENPGTCLAVLVAVTVLAVLMETVSARRRRRVLRQLAVQWRMTYTPTDRLRLTARVADKLPVPGAADLDVSDVIYGSDGESRRYVFTVRYTVGVVRGKRSLRRVAALTEARGRRVIAADDSEPIRMADEQLSLIDQYRSLDPSGSPAIPPPSPRRS